ncbi:MAG: YihY/virulence factor BrkB family protein [Bacteroidales bacterium]|nr:YihY/virulence factor BrkB family protein [Bacteroidales bacterium]
MKLKETIAGIKKFLIDDLWTLNMEELSRTKARLVQDIRVVVNAVQQIGDNNVGLLSASLCYFCTMAVVPFLAVCFALTGGLGLSEKLKEIMFSNFGPDNAFINMILDAADNILTTAQSGGFGLISALMFIWLIIWMMDRVEKVFNAVWGVRKMPRKRFFSYSVDLAIVMLAPFVILIFFTGSIVYSNVLDYILPKGIGFSASIKSLLGWVIFGAVIVMVFSAMYKFIPSVEVKYRYALKAALLAGIAFTGLQYLYLETQLLVTRINAVYGTVAAIPLFLLWLRFGWMIIVFGVQFSYSFQAIGEQGTLPETTPVNENL